MRIQFEVIDKDIYAIVTTKNEKRKVLSGFNTYTDNNGSFDIIHHFYIKELISSNSNSINTYDKYLIDNYYKLEHAKVKDDSYEKTELEIANIERDLEITDLEIAVLELQQ